MVDDVVRVVCDLSVDRKLTTLEADRIARGEKLRTVVEHARGGSPGGQSPANATTLSNTNSLAPFACAVRTAIRPRTPAPITMVFTCEPGVMIT